jgi:acyl-CoA synthetase (AMP-forming)/AMP-acid ligase II
MLLRRALDVFNCDFVQTFAAGTEAGGQTVLTAEDHRRALDLEPDLLASIGRPAFGVALRLVDDDLHDVEPGRVGEIATRSATVMSGYLGQPEESAAALAGGWFRAGDMAWADERGYLYLAGRKNDMIIRGGENVYPIEIETVLADFPGVSDVAVIGLPSEEWGETVCAVIALQADGERPTDDELCRHCRDRLAAYKVPTRFEYRAELPVNASGKVLKTELRQALALG